MIALPSIVETGLKQTVIKFWKKLCSDRQYLLRFLFFVCMYMVLAKTLISDKDQNWFGIKDTFRF